MTMKRIVYYQNHLSDGTNTLANLANDPAFDTVVLPYIFPVVNDSDHSINVSAKGPLFSQREELTEQVQMLKSHGKAVFFAFGGPDVASTTYSRCSRQTEQLAKIIARDWVSQHGADGVEIHFCDHSALSRGGAQVQYEPISFLVDFTRQIIAAGKALSTPVDIRMSHATPTAYWDKAKYGNAYGQIYSQIGKDLCWVVHRAHTDADYDGTAQQRMQWYSNINAKGVPSTKLIAGYDEEALPRLPYQIWSKEVVAPLRCFFGNEFGGIAQWEYNSSSH
eukprot:TRINITY_DN2575_c0_g1_i1.p1 TRINITY_DN2575_c0_g1~~TRINITY_DN2575_c0_g1_i1.p1  ORF type:complete len:278 (+),score=41.29 TRINITY_DN2575_c0_g1_i1:79-912(+)